MNGIILSPSLQFVPKKWGYERWIVNNDLYCGKILFFVKDHRCSFHYHKIKQETFYVQEGKVIMLYSQFYDQMEKKKEEVSQAITWVDQRKLQSFGIFHSGLNINYDILEKNDVFEIPCRMVHQVIALQDSTILEVSTHHEDSDSYRISMGG